jgi:hypothetical protein
VHQVAGDHQRGAIGLFGDGLFEYTLDRFEIRHVPLQVGGDDQATAIRKLDEAARHPGTITQLAQKWSA